MKRIKVIVFLIVIVAVVCANIINATSVFDSSCLALENVEAMGDSEPWWFSDTTNKEIYTEQYYTCYKRVTATFFSDGYIAYGNEVNNGTHGQVMNVQVIEIAYTGIDCPAGNNSCKVVPCHQ